MIYRFKSHLMFREGHRLLSFGFCLAVVLLTSGCDRLEAKKSYYPDGKLMAERFELGNSARVRAYHHTGKLVGEYKYKNNKLHGTTRIYDNDGHLAEIKKYRHGELLTSKTMKADIRIEDMK